MKQYRNGLIAALIVGAGFLVWKSLHKTSPSGGAAPSTSDSNLKSQAKKSLGKTTEMASEEAPTSASQEPGRRNDSFPEPRIHLRMRTPHLKVQRDLTPFPMNNNELSSSSSKYDDKLSSSSSKYDSELNLPSSKCNSKLSSSSLKYDNKLSLLFLI